MIFLAIRDPDMRVAADSDEAIEVCHKGARARLKAPTSAQFPRHSKVDVGVFRRASIYQGIPIPKGTRTITSYVDSQNSFGAMLRSKVECLVSPTHELLVIDIRPS